MYSSTRKIIVCKELLFIQTGNLSQSKYRHLPGACNRVRLMEAQISPISQKTCLNTPISGGTISGESNLYVLNTFVWWRHQMETFCALLAICAGNSQVTGEFPAQRPVTRRFDVFFDLRPNKPLSKQWWGWWFEAISRPLWRHCNASFIIWNWNDTGSWNPSTWKTNNCLS